MAYYGPWAPKTCSDPKTPGTIYMQTDPQAGLVACLISSDHRGNFLYAAAHEMLIVVVDPNGTDSNATLVCDLYARYGLPVFGPDGAPY